MSDLQKTKNINIPKKKLCNAGYEISADYPLFLNIKLDRNKTISIWVANLSLRNDYVRIVDLYKIKNQTNSHISYRQTTLTSNIYIYHI